MSKTSIVSSHIDLLASMMASTTITVASYLTNEIFQKKKITLRLVATFPRAFGNKDSRSLHHRDKSFILGFHLLFPFDCMVSNAYGKVRDIFQRSYRILPPVFRA